MYDDTNAGLNYVQAMYGNTCKECPVLGYNVLGSKNFEEQSGVQILSNTLSLNKLQALLN